jgi:Cys-rich protein (TIGR01571 family)
MTRYNLGSISPSAQTKNRADIRERYGIRGDIIGDCFTSCFCEPGVLVQERRELELEEGSLS